MTKKAKVIAFGAGLLLALLLLLSGCREGLPVHTKPKPPVEVYLSMRGKPALGEHVNLILKVKMLVDAPNTTMCITLPVGIELVRGELCWQGDFKKDETRQLEVTVRTVEDGYYKIVGWVQAILREKLYMDIGDGDVLYLLVEGSEAWVGKRPPKDNWEDAPAVGPGLPKNTHLVRTRFFLRDELALGKETELVYEVTPLIDLHRVSIGIWLPISGISVIETKVPSEVNIHRSMNQPEGLFAWDGQIAKGQKVVITIRIKPVTTGETNLYAYVHESRKDGTTIVLCQDSIRDLKLYTPRMAE
jgi:hypothetical protein